MQIKNYTANVTNENWVPAMQLEKGDWFTDDKRNVYEVNHIGRVIRGTGDRGVILLQPSDMVFLLSKQLQLF